MAFDLSIPILAVDDYNTMTRIIRDLSRGRTYTASDFHTWLILNRDSCVSTGALHVYV
jgi:hypothetical protein